MREFRAWIPFGLALVATPVALLVGITSAGAGHGKYFWAKALFPYTMLSTIVFQSIINLFFVLAVVQFPLYGFILSLFSEKKFAGLILMVIHISTAILCFILIGENFS